MILRTFAIEMTLYVVFRMSEEANWTTEESFITCCEGEDKLLMWKYSIEENESLIELKWFYNSTTLLAQYSVLRGFRAAPSYKGRIVQRETTGILLKQLSSDDTGEYNLYPKVAGVQIQDIQSIVLRVYEPPTYQCKPKIETLSKNVISCSTKSCRGQQLSLEWRIFGKHDPVSNQSYLEIESSWNAKLVFCCLQGPNMKCHNGDTYKFCVSTPLVSTDEGIPDSHFRDTDKTIAMIIVASVSTFVIIISIFVVLVCCYRRLKLLTAKSQNANMDERFTRYRGIQHAPELTENIEGPKIVNNIIIDPEAFMCLLDSARKQRGSRKDGETFAPYSHNTV